MIKRLRPKWSEEELAKIYAKPHDHRIYGRGHTVRVEVTQNILKDMARLTNAKSGADLSCGNAAILNSLSLKEKYLGDYASGYEFVGPLEDNLEKMPNVDIYVCSETLEHLDNPGHALKLIREKSKSLILSTPIEQWEDTNAEHYWAYDREGVEELLKEAGWVPNVFLFLDTQVFGEPYKYGIWGCL
jgi:hypothetical protein